MKTTMKIMENKGYSKHEAVLLVSEDIEGTRSLHIHGPKGCMISLPWEDVLEAGMEFCRWCGAKMEE